MSTKITFHDRLECLIKEEYLRNSRIPKLITSTEDAKKYMQQTGYQDGYNDAYSLDELDGKGEEGMREYVRRLAQISPVVAIRLTRLDCIDPRTNEHAETSVLKVSLYDLTWLGANQVVVIGRNPSCDLRPFIHPLKEIEDLHRDGIPTDMEISELHGIIYLKRGKLFYKDRSANGSTDNDDRALFHSRFEWRDPFKYVGLGEIITIQIAQKRSYTDSETGRFLLKRELLECRQSRFKLWWSTVDLPEFF